jgi:hypothetical protein
MSNQQRDMVVLSIGGASSGRQEEIDAAPPRRLRSEGRQNASGLWRPCGQTIDIESIFACNCLKYRHLSESGEIRPRKLQQPMTPPSIAREQCSSRLELGSCRSRIVATVHRSNLRSVARAVKHEHKKRCNQAIDPEEVPAVGFQPAAQPFQGNHSSKKRAEHADQTGEKHTCKSM